MIVPEIPMTSAERYPGYLAGKEVIPNCLDYEDVFLRSAFFKANPPQDQIFQVLFDGYEDGVRKLVLRNDAGVAITAPAALFNIYEP